MAKIRSAYNFTVSELAQRPSTSYLYNYVVATATGLPSISRSGKAPTAYVSVQVTHLGILRKTGTIKQQYDPEWHENLAP